VVRISSTISVKPLFMGLRKFFLLKKRIFYAIRGYTEPYVPDDFPPSDFPESREEYIERRRNTPMHLCRLRHFSEDRWSVAYYSYSKMKYDPCVFENGSFEGTPEEGFEVGAMYLGND